MNEKILNGLLKELLSSDFAKQIEAVYRRLTSAVDVSDEFGMDPVFVKMLRPLFEFLYKDWWRVEVCGAENIPASGPAIIAPNHSGMLPYDAVMINLAVHKEHKKHRNVRFLVADFVENFPILSLFIARAGGAKASPENAGKLLKKGEVVCVFPEGVGGIGKLYRDRYKLQEFGGGGIVRAAKEYGAPIIPCAVIGAEETHPILWKSEDLGKKMGLPFFPVTPTFPLLGLLGLIPMPSKWKIIFGKPIRCCRSKKSADKLTVELKAIIQEMINKEIDV